MTGEGHPATPDDDVVLRLEGVSKVYSGTVAVRHADFDVRRGAVNVLVGENGAGKSTLMKIIAGVVQPTDGRILLDGKPVTFRDAGEAVAHGIGMVFQELNLFGNLSVAENIFAAREIVRLPFGIDHRAQERRAAEFLERLEAGIDARTPVEDLRIGQQQLVEIAKAVAQDARILIMDEPTAALGPQETAQVGELIKQLKSEGIGIFLISHDIHDVFHLADRVAVMKNGQVVGTAKVGDVTEDEVLGMIILGKCPPGATPGPGAVN